MAEVPPMITAHAPNLKNIYQKCYRKLTLTIIMKRNLIMIHILSAEVGFYINIWPI